MIPGAKCQEWRMWCILARVTRLRQTYMYNRRALGLKWLVSRKKLVLVCRIPRIHITFQCWFLFFLMLKSLFLFILKFNEQSMKWIKNQSKIDQKWTNNRSTIAKNRGLEGSGAGLEASWAVLGDPKRLWRHLGLSWRRLGGVLEASGILEASWAVLDRERWPTWFQLGSKRSPNQLKIDPKIDQCFNASWNRILEGFWWILDTKMKQSWAQNGIKNRC